MRSCFTVVFLLATLAAAALPVSAGPPEIIEVEPPQGYVDEDVEVTLTGEGFDLGAGVLLTPGGGPDTGQPQREQLQYRSSLCHSVGTLLTSISSHRAPLWSRRTPSTNRPET